MILDLVKQKPGCCVNDVCEYFEMSRVGVMKHIRVLVNAKLVISRKQGRTRELYFNSAPIQFIYDRWTDEYSAFWATQALDLKYTVEGKKTSGKTQRSKSKKDSRKRNVKRKS